MKHLGVSFDNFHTFRDWGLHLENYEVSEPVPITHYIDIPGRKTKIDATESLYGRVTYQNRTLTFSFWIKCFPSAWMRLDSKIQRAIGGKRCKIILDTEPDRYWMGRVTVHSERMEEANYVLALYTISCDVEPYKYWDTTADDWLWDPFSFVDGYIQNLKNLNVSGSLSQKVVITVPCYPVILSSAAMTVRINGKTYSLKSGTNELEDELPENEYTFVFTGTGTVSIGWKGETL